MPRSVGISNQHDLDIILRFSKSYKFLQLVSTYLTCCRPPGVGFYVLLQLPHYPPLLNIVTFEKKVGYQEETMQSINCFPCIIKRGKFEFEWKKNKNSSPNKTETESTRKDKKNLPTDIPRYLVCHFHSRFHHLVILLLAQLS